MVGLPVNFPLPSESASVSYDWFDFATGAGYKTFYGIGAQETTNKQYFLHTSLIESDVNNRNTDSLGEGSHVYNFDLNFSIPVTIAAGAAIAGIEISSTAAVSVYATIGVYHVRGVTETSLGSASTRTISNTMDVECVTKFNLTKKAFAIGDTLRLKVTLVSGGNSGKFVYAEATPLKISIPFEVKN